MPEKDVMTLAARLHGGQLAREQLRLFVERVFARRGKAFLQACRALGVLLLRLVLHPEAALRLQVCHRKGEEQRASQEDPHPARRSARRQANRKSRCRDREPCERSVKKQELESSRDGIAA